MNSGDASSSTAGGKKPAFVTKWTCDVCQICAFDTFEAAAEHEKTCTGPPPPADEKKEETTIDLTNLDDNLSPDVKKTPSSPPSNQSNVPNGAGTPPAGTLTVWTCDICRSAEFSTFEEAAEHEKNCTGTAESLKQQSSADTNLQSKASGGNARPWLCDKCQVADFATYEEAVEHEKTCPGKPKDTAVSKQPPPEVTPATAEQKRPSSSQVRPPSLLCLSPLVRDENDIPEYTLLSTFHAKLLRSLDLLEIQTGGGEQQGLDGRAIRLRCHYCQHTLPNPSNFLSVGKIILWDLFNHLTSGCKSVPHEHIDLIKVVKTTSEEGKITLGDFLSRFFGSNGFKELGDGLVAPDCQRGRLMKASGTMHSSAPPSPKEKAPPPTSRSLPVSSASTTDPALTRQLTSLVFPLIHKTFETQSSGLSPFLRLALSQMNLHPNVAPVETKQHGVYSLDLKCKHCLSSSKVQSRDSLHKAVYSLTYSHLSKSCSRIPSETRASLETLQNKKRGSASSQARGGNTGVRQFCKYLVSEYDIIDILPDDGYLPGIGIHQSSIQKAVRCAIPKPQKPPEIAPKRYIEPSDSMIKTAKRRRGSVDRKSEEEMEGFLEQDEDGHQFYIPPPGGVPLISTQSAIMSSKLSRYNLLIFDQLELFEANDLRKSVRFRCQNCKADPRLVVTSTPTAVRLLHKYVKQMSSHVPDCRCLSPHIRQEIEKAQKNKKDKGTVSLNEYCEYLVSLYDMKDTRSGVVFGAGEPIRSGYCGEPGDPLSYKINTKDHNEVTTISAVPRHSLIPLAQSSSEGIANKVIRIRATGSKRMVLSNCNFLMAAQYKFVLVQRKMPVGGNSTQHPATERAKRSRSPTSIPDLAVGLRCQHCDYTRTLLNIRDFSQQSTHFLFSHLQKCPKYPEDRKKELNELRVTQSFQKNETVASIAEYARKLIPELYGMTDLEWNGVSGGVGFDGNIQSTMNLLRAKYGNSKHLMHKIGSTSDDISWESFALPLVLEDEVESISAELPTKVSISAELPTKVAALSSSQIDVPCSDSIPNAPLTHDSTQNDSAEPSKTDAGAQATADLSFDDKRTAEGSSDMQTSNEMKATGGSSPMQIDVEVKIADSGTHGKDIVAPAGDGTIDMEVEEEVKGAVVESGESDSKQDSSKQDGDNALNEGSAELERVHVESNGTK